MRPSTRRTLGAFVVTTLAVLLAACGAGDAPATVTATAAVPAAAPEATATSGVGGLGEFGEFGTPDAARAFAHLRVLAGEIGPRPATTEAERRAAVYIAEQLESAGYRVALEPFDVEVPVDRSTVTPPKPETQLPARALAGSPFVEATGRLVAGGLGQLSDLEAIDAEGAVLVLDRGLITFAEKASNAEAAGAVAVIIVNDRPGFFGGTLGGAAVTIPVVGVAQERAEPLDRIAAAGLAVTVLARVEQVVGQSQNVVGRASDAECEGYLGAHYDSIAAGPGANDNASGTAALIELARTYRVEGLCVIAFGAEEVGLFGSRAFVAAHDIENARFMLNLDMVAKITGWVFVTPTGDRASGALAERAVGVAEALGYEVPAGPFPSGSSSDSFTFSEAGVPAITVHSGDDPAIHTASDDLDNVSPQDHATMLEIASAVLRALLTD